MNTYHILHRRTPRRKTRTPKEALQEPEKKEPAKAVRQRRRHRQHDVQRKRENIGNVPSEARNFAHRREDERTEAVAHDVKGQAQGSFGFANAEVGHDLGLTRNINGGAAVDGEGV